MNGSDFTLTGEARRVMGDSAKFFSSHSDSKAEDTDANPV
jgi:hypothetical protein